MITARDGTPVPVSIVSKKGLPIATAAGRLHLYGYGAYGYRDRAGLFDHAALLLDRGFAYAIAHIRGGDDLGSNGISMASSTSAPTPSTISSMWRRG
jgi:oligopeptidase B